MQFKDNQQHKKAPCTKPSHPMVAFQLDRGRYLTAAAPRDTFKIFNISVICKFSGDHHPPAYSCDTNHLKHWLTWVRSGVGNSPGSLEVSERLRGSSVCWPSSTASLSIRLVRHFAQRHCLHFICYFQGLHVIQCRRMYRPVEMDHLPEQNEVD